MPPARIPIAEDHKKQAFIDWLVTPPRSRQPTSQEALAKEIGVDPRTLVNWKTQADFREAWQARSVTVIGHPDRAQEVLDALFTVARDPKARNHVAAAKLYLEAIDAIKPKRVDVTVSSKEAEKLTDDELDALIALGAAELKAARNGG